MVTSHSPRTVSLGVEATKAEEETGDEDSLIQRALLGVQRVLCGLHGHDELLHFQDKRIFLRCATCGHETPGWAIDLPHPQIRFHGEPHRHLLSPVAGLVESRKVA
ncbi:MAG: hypothetical protein ACE148_06310 [Vicinamibacterales bacterium]